MLAPPPAPLVFGYGQLMSDDREINDSMGMSDRVDAVIRVETVRGKAHMPTVATITADAEVLKAEPASPEVDTDTVTYTIEITGLITDSHYKLYDGAGTLLDSGVGDSLVDAFVAMGIRLGDGPDPSVPNN
jgi:hypothetical protein